MKGSPNVNSSRGQLKIQQMAFVLVALVIFFGIVFLIFINFKLAGLKESAGELNEESASELVRKISSSAEFSFTPRMCSSCIDLDKVLVLKDRESYEGFWQLDYLQIVKVHPEGKGECTKANYPNCGEITLIEEPNFGTPSEAFVSLCRWESKNEGYFKCELGKIYASGEDIK